MRRRMGYRWHLRQLMAKQELFATTELQPLLVERGIELSREQVYRLVTGTPERLNLHVFAALCDILGCEPGELFEPVAAPTELRKTASDKPAAGQQGGPRLRRPPRARIVPPESS